jgi:hypothetical protein
MGSAVECCSVYDPVAMIFGCADRRDSPEEPLVGSLFARRSGEGSTQNSPEQDQADDER